jgi:hypothetical protein
MLGGASQKFFDQQGARSMLIRKVPREKEVLQASRSQVAQTHLAGIPLRASE